VGVKLVGGCCGTTPQHIAAINTMLADYAPSRTVSPASQSLKAAVEAVHERADAVHHDHVHDVVDGVMQDQADAPSAFARHVQQKSFMISVEMSPPRSVKYTRFLQNALYIRDCGADVINITDNAMAHVRMSNIAAARLIQQHLGIETIAHFTPRDRNLMAVQSDLIGAHATGIATILAVTGDPPHHGDFPNATGIWDVDSIGLISIMHNLNQGLDARGRKLAVPASFCIGCAANPAATDIDLDLERLNRKIEQGAQFIMTQPVFDADVLLHYIVLYEQRYGKIPLPILMGLQPLHSYQQAEKFHHEVPGIVIPEAVRARMQQAGSAGGEEGVAISKEIFEQALPVIQGVYIMPLDRFALVGELLPFIRQRTQVSVSTHTESN
jgi:homocysteine S-methyltransferase